MRELAIIIAVIALWSMAMLWWVCESARRPRADLG